MWEHACPLLGPVGPIPDRASHFHQLVEGPLAHLPDLVVRDLATRSTPTRKTPISHLDDRYHPNESEPSGHPGKNRPSTPPLKAPKVAAESPESPESPHLVHGPLKDGLEDRVEVGRIAGVHHQLAHVVDDEGALALGQDLGRHTKGDECVGE